MKNRLDEKDYETMGAHSTADLIETHTRIRLRVNKTYICVRFCSRWSDLKNENEARKCSSLYHRNNKSIYYVSFKRAGKMKRILCFYWLPERSKQDGPLLVPRDLPRWILRPQLKIPLFGHIKNPLSRSRWLSNGLVLFALLCLPLGF